MAKDTPLDLTDRPYIKRHKHELFQQAKTNWHSMAELAWIWLELRHRRLRAGERSELDAMTARLKALTDAWFKWRAAEAEPGSGPPPAGQWPQEGVLKRMGYSVGQKAEADAVRQRVLDAVFVRQLPYVFDAEYMAQWGEPGTPDRLRKMAYSIATFAANNLRNGQTAPLAVAQWTADLEYLRVKYYVGKFGFDWPVVD